MGLACALGYGELMSYTLRMITTLRPTDQGLGICVWSTRVPLSRAERPDAREPLIAVAAQTDK